MASVVGEASSSSPPSASIPPRPRSCTYHVYLSFSGKDARNGITGHLQAALERKGIKTFTDHTGLKTGDVIKDELWKAIEESMFAITVFSPNYASSSWCLDELHKIVECSKNMGLEVVPVFYGVEPSDVRYQKGSFKEAFEKHEKRFGENSERVRIWRDVLAEAASLSVKDLKDEHEATLVEGIAEHIHKKLIPKLPSSTENLVGIASRVEEVMRHIDIGLDDVRFIGIWGIGGIGKTTIARAVYEAIQGEFEISCFLANVREACESNRIVEKQKQLLAKVNIIVNTSDDEHDVQKKIQTSLCSKKVLLVLDDVDDEVQLRNLAGDQDWFGLGSRIIITTRDIHLLKIYEVHGTYEVQGLVDIESSYLFCLKAFNKEKKLDEKYLDLVKEVVKYSGGLPLALEVLGSHLCGRSVNDWHDAIEKKKGPPFDEIHDTLKISYNSLDVMEKNIFLDIACFFEGQQTDYVRKLLEICGYNAKIGINILIDRSLVKINEETNVFEMHGLLQDMGRSIIIQESLNNPDERSRLWSGEDINLVLKNNKGSEAIQAIVLWSGWFGQHWSAKAFSNMTQLKLLIIDSGGGFRDLSGFPTSLKVLHYRDYPLKTLALVDQQYEFVEIKLKYSNIENLWHGKKFLGKLKYLNLSYSSQLKQTPDLSEVPILQTLVLKGCSSLTEVHPSVVHHKGLTLLDLTECISLEALPGKLEMSSLNELILDDCSSFENLPEFGECMKSLSRLSLERTPIKKLPTSLGRLVGLKDLNIRGCKNIECLCDITDEIPLLRTLNLASVVDEASSSSPPSASIPPPPPRPCTYHVFLSFSGKDTRNGLTGHLLAALERKGIKTFIDDRDLEMSEDMKNALWKAIKESMFAITVFSPNYASSSWCLDELQHIVECRKKLGLSIVPVFYGVEPWHVRHQKESFGEEFKKQEDIFGQNSEKVAAWRNALAEIANLSGKDFKDEHEATLVKSIADHIHKKLIPKLPSSTKNLVGIASRVEEVIKHIGIGLNDVRFIGIWGMGGIGKTTIARAVYEAIQGKFEASCFLANVREAWERNRIVDKQNELVAQANIGANIFYNEYEGQRAIQHSLGNKKVLLVLDNVSDEVQLRNLAEEQNWFGAGSRIIITTRDIHLLNFYEVQETYKVQGLVDSESFDLFCLKAFKQKKLDESYLDLAKEVVKYSGGLPLALEVLGSHLCGRSIEVWHDAIEKIKSTPFPKIHNALKISYDSLDVMEKDIFLDIACFFEGEKTDYITKLLEICGYNARIGIDVLIDRSLVKINEESNVFEMHDLLQDMGRSVVIQESPNNPGQRSRIWSCEDIDLVLANNKVGGSSAIQGIVSRLSWPIKYGRSWSAEAFSNMTQLKLLIITDKEDDFCELNSLPTSLKVLEWQIYPSKTLPLSDQQYELVEIRLEYSYIENLWHGKKYLGKLKHLNLSHSNQLKQTPDLSEVPMLQTLLFICCESLTEVHPSVVHHKSLTLLDLTGCYKLKALPGKLEMSSLNELILDDCFEFENLPEFGECMKSLSRLSLAWTAIEKLPTSLGCLVGLKDLNIRGCDNIECLRDIIEGIPLLRTLNLASAVGEASSSSPPSTSIPPRPRSRTYHVFLSFSRKDTRKGITGHLHASLERKGIKTFIDDKDLKTGEVISSELPKAIEESMFAITVFSPNYASSSWCLNELQHIVECSKSQGLSIVPVFYGVKPSDVRYQKGSFGEAFKKHEERFGQNSEKIRRWRDALAEVASLSGMDFKDEHEATLVKSIADRIHKKLIPKLPFSTKNLVGIASRVEEVIRHIGIGLNDVRIIGIWGMGGIGKTTIARAVYEAIQEKFEVSCFLANVREAWERNKIVDKQKQLLAKANISANAFSDEYEGRRIIQYRLCNKKVLLALDDVSNEVQLRNLAEEQHWFGPGSRIIITTRDRHLLKIHNVHQIYKVQDLVDSESFDLFCLKAFKLKKLDEKYLDLVKEVVKYSGGLPLALEVLGSHLCGRSVDVWRDAIGKIKSTPFPKIHNVLKISYDSLEDMEKNIFLDIACFFEGKEKDFVTKLSKKYGYYGARIGVDILIDRSLVKINEESNVFEMHGLLQDMGRSLVIQESPNNPSKRRKL